METKESLHVKSFLNNYFDHIYVVNLKSAVKNRLTAITHLNKHKINFEIFKATNGYVGEPLSKFKEYQKRKLGDLKRYPEYSEKEIQRGQAYISSAGAMGYIYTYLRILEDAKKNGYKRFLILEDDILLSENFEKKFKNFIQAVNEDWKILLLGASQYGWDSVDLNTANEKGYYYPRSVDTCGSFAIAFDSSIIDELIEAQSAFEAPFDFLPIGELYERYLGKCFVAYPNIVIPDVEDSTIRGKRSQYSHSELMKWPLTNFDFPLDKPSISVFITNKDNLKYYSCFSNTAQLPFNLRLFFNSNDGVRPLHNIELLDKIENEIQPLDSNMFAPESDYTVMIDEDEVLIESDIVKFLEYKINIREKNTTPLKEINVHRKKVVKGRVSVIIPTYKRPENLKNALTSVVTQDYHDIEIIIVSDNGKDSEFTEDTRQLVSSFYGQNTNCDIVLLEHTVNRKGSAARNTGIIHSTGEYICFLDDDDIYLQGRLSKSIKKLIKTRKNTAAVYCGFIGWNSKEHDLNRYKTGDLTLEILLLDYKKHYLCSNTGTYKREAILSLNGFDESYNRHQDLEFNLRFFEQYKIDALKECLVKLTPEPTNINNKVYNLSMLALKEKFLNQFAYIIQTYEDTIIDSIYKAHWSETKKYILDKNAFIDEMNKNLKEGFLFHILKQDTINNDKYQLIMQSISALTKVSVKKQPLQKFSRYKSVIKTYHNIKK